MPPSSRNAVLLVRPPETLRPPIGSLAVQVLLYGAAAAVGAGNQQRELQELAAVEGQRLDLFFSDYRSLRTRFPH